MSRNRRPELAFDAITIEGSLLAADWLARVSQLKAPHQAPADYGVPKGLDLRDEIGRYWRVAQAHWADFEAGRKVKAEPNALSRRFIVSLLREAFGFSDLAERPPVSAASLLDAPRGDDARQPLERQGRAWPITAIDPAGRVPLVCGPAGAGLDSPHKHLGDEGRKRSAFGLIQELLNASDDAMWGLCSDGLTLRLVRDNASLTRPAWVEVDLARIFSEGLYPDFAAAWLLLHRSRFGNDEQAPEACVLETWRTSGREEGTRAHERLREGFEHAILTLGQGFLSHPANQELRRALHGGTLSAQDYFGQLLRLVYRLIFLLTAEERGLLHPQGTPKDVQDRYSAGYGLQRLRDRSPRRAAHDQHADLWEAIKLTFRGLGTGEPSLGLPVLGGLFAPSQCATLDAARLPNRALLGALFRLCWLRDTSGLARVNWRDMGPEELGSVYEGLLELVPQITQDGRQFNLLSGHDAKGNARKTTGSFYTHEALVHALLDKALEPVIADTIAKAPDRPADAILSLAVVDPACGSGHFLLAAARRLATHVARLQSSGTPSAAEYRHALRQVVSRCIYGVDLNPMAVELCKVGLWMEAVEPGLPLSFLDSHIQCGNALFGAELALMTQGPPDDAWTALKGEDKKRAANLKAANKNWRQTLLFDATDAPSRDVEVRKLAAQVESIDDDSIAAVHKKETLWRELESGEAGRHATLLADLWCASFVWPKLDRQTEAAAPVRSLWESVKRDANALRADTAAILADLKQRFRFFHWHLAFPTVMERGGFDVVLGNPPWDSLSPDRREYFGQHHPGIRSLSPEEQEAVIDELLTEPAVSAGWDRHQLDLFGLVHFLKNSGRYTLFAPGNLGKGDFNVYRMFVELALNYTRPGGYNAQVVPGGLYGGANASAIRKFIFDKCELKHLWGLINTTRAWFPKVDIDRFAAYSTRRGGKTTNFLAQFGLMHPIDLANEPIEFDADFIRNSNPDTYTIPDIRSPADMTVAQKMLAAYPAFGDMTAGPPHRDYQRELDMGNDRHRFTTDPAGLPVYEGRMVTHFDHRAKTYVSGHGNSSKWTERAHDDPAKAIVPQWRVLRENIPDKLGSLCDRYRLAFGDVANPRNERSFTAALVPPGVICGHTVPTIVFADDEEWMYLPWLAAGNSFVMDWFTRKKLSSPHLTFSVLDSLPFPRPTLDDGWVKEACPLVLRLICTAPEMTPFWNRMAALGLCQSVAPGTVPTEALLVEAERDLARAQLDAIVAHDVYGLTRQELSDVLETFPVVKKRDLKAHGEYRTKRLILEAFDAKAATRATPKPMTSTARTAQPDTSPPEIGKVLAFPARPAAQSAVTATASRAPQPNLEALETGAWTRPRSMPLGETQAAILAVLKAHGDPIPRSRARVAALLCLEPHLLTPLLDKTDQAQWVRLVGEDATKRKNAKLDDTTKEWGKAVRDLRGRGRLVENLDLGTWALAGDLPETVGWPDGRATFVLDALRRLDQATEPEAVVSKLPEKARLWLVQDAA